MIFFLNDNDSVYCDCFTSRVSVDSEKHVMSIPMLMNQRVGHHHASGVNAVIHLYRRRQNTRCSCSTDAYDVKQVLKTFCIHAVAGPERATQTVFSTTHHYFCYRHLNNRSTGKHRMLGNQICGRISEKTE